MTEEQFNEFHDAAIVLDYYVDKYIRDAPGGDSWWIDHDGHAYTDDVGYFLEMWEDILIALRVGGRSWEKENQSHEVSPDSIDLVQLMRDMMNQEIRDELNNCQMTKGGD